MRCILFFFLISLHLLAQEKTNNNSTFFYLTDSLNSKIQLGHLKSYEQVQKKLYKEGYFYFTSELKSSKSVDSIAIDLGKRTDILAIQISSKELQKYLKTKKTEICIIPKDLDVWIEQLSSYFDEKGENFSEIKLTHQITKNDTLFCNININRSAKRKVDKVVIKGYHRFPKKFIKHYLHQKKTFSKTLLRETEKKINQLAFVKNKQKPAVLFTKDSTHLYLYLERVKANKLDALLGFSNQGESGDFQFNGHIDIALTNTLHKGESFSFSWKNNGQEQEEILLNLESPYVFNSPLFVGYSLNIYKQDSSFVNTQNKFLLGYQPHFKHKISTYFLAESSANISETKNIEAYKKKHIGFIYSYKEMNEWKIPKKLLFIDIAYGVKETEQNTPQQTIKTELIYNIPISNTHFLYLQNRNAWLGSNNKTFNELYRTGGATTMRGFLEQSIVAHLYNYSNIEYRLFTNSNSYLYGFGDVGYFKNLTQENNLLSLGLGYTFGTRGGLLKISYAVGKSNHSNFDLNTGLFHVNFVTLF
ncbi:BamA/TamA family outer membrane protein [Ochrovirga pacifica]|uniref:hypothetical protein n=1 Tax=Ochrovirga pacifica TaxID=1042376 RepID=UPI0002557C0A|nr:hypothetical protein [Ochrovirga pacifica]